jgi:hypothetical protein
VVPEPDHERGAAVLEPKPQVTDPYPAIVVKELRFYARAMRPKSRDQGKPLRPNPESPFYVPPPSSNALRWSLVIFLLGPALLAGAAIEFALAHQWTGLAIVLVMLCGYSLMKWVQIRAVLKELARRRV